jgi:putative aldouronate transport system permease protein
MKKKVSPFLVALPVFVVILALKVFPLLYNFIVSFLEYNMKLGIGGSKFVGFDNFYEFLGSFYFWRLLRNTLLLTFLSVISTSLVSFVAAICINKLPKNWIKCLALSILAIPAFVPVPVLCGVIKDLMSSGSYVTGFLYNIGIVKEKANLLTNPSLYPFIYALAETLRFMIYPTMMGVLISRGNGYDDVVRILRVIGAYALVRFAFLFVMDNELTISLYNPMVYESADTIYSFTYRKGLLESYYGYSAAVDTIKVLLQSVVNILLAIGIGKLLIGDDMSFKMPSRKNFSFSTVIAVIGLVIVSLGSVAIVYSLISGVLKSPGAFGEIIFNENVVRALVNGFVYSVGAAVVFTLFSVFLAYPLTTRSKVYKLCLFLLVFLGGTISEWLTFRTLGFIDSIYGAILATGISVAGAFIIYLFSWQKTRETKDFGHYLLHIAPAAGLVLALSFILFWGSAGTMIFLRTGTKFPISILLRQLLVQHELSALTTETVTEEYVQAIRYAAGIIGSLPPLIVGWLVIWFNRLFFRTEINETSPVEAAAGEVQ